MSTKLQDLYIEISAKTEKLEKAMGKAEKSVDAFAKKTKISLKNVGVLFAGLSGALAIGSAAVFKFAGAINSITEPFALMKARVAELTKETGDFNTVFKELERISRDTGSGLEATVSTFQRLSFARKDLNATNAEMLTLVETVQQLGVIGGASTEGLKAGLLQFGQAMSSGIVRAEEFNSLLENLPLVATEIADSLGMSTGELRKMVTQGEITSKQVFDALLSKAEEVGVKFDDLPKRLAVAQAAMSQTMQSLLADFDEGVGGTEALIAITEALTGKMGDLGDVFFMVGDLIKRFVVGAISSFQALHHGVAMVFNGIASIGSTVMAALSETVRININRMLNVINSMVKQMNKIPGVDLGKGVSPIGAMQGVFGQDKRAAAQNNAAFKNSQLAMDTALKNIGKSFVGTVRMPSKGGGGLAGGGIVDQLLATSGGADGAGKAADKAGKDIAYKFKEGFEEKLTELVGSNFTDPIMAKFDEMAKDLSESFGGIAQGMISPLIAEQEKFNEAWATYADLIERGHETEIERLETMEKLNYLLAEGAINQEAFTAATEALNEKLEETAEKTDDWGNRTQQVAQWAGQALDGAFDTLINGITTGEFKFKEFIGSMLAELGKLIFKLLVVQPLIDALGGAFGGGGGGIGKLFGRATGGHVQANTPYMVGERGAEVFVPSRSGSIVPNHAMGNGGQGLSVTNVFNISTGVQQTVRAEIAAMMPQIEKRTTTGVLQARARGGKMAAAMGAKS